MRKPFVVGNWKMHNTLAEARALIRGVRERLAGRTTVDVGFCPPFTVLFPMCKEIDGTALLMGAQNAYCENAGAFTGEISPGMLADAGCRFALIGHSERRHLFGERGPLLKRKVAACVRAGLDVIYCVGETLDERQAERTNEVVDRQIAEVLTAGLDPTRLTVAYEPVWAIGTGVNATPQQAQSVHAHLRDRLAKVYSERASSLRILYGGSVKPGNAAELMGQPDVDGALVGGACLVVEDFVAIIAAAAGGA